MVILRPMKLMDLSQHYITRNNVVDLVALPALMHGVMLSLVKRHDNTAVQPISCKNAS